MRRFAFVVAFTLAATTLAGTACVGGKQQISSEDKDRLKAYVLDAMPADPAIKKVDINFENKVRLVGYKVEPELAGPGAQVKTTYYWQCNEPVEEGWQLFTHLQHEGFDRFDNIDASGPIREIKGRSQVLGPDRWERGKFYVDEQTLTMPAELRGPESILYVGIYKNDARLRIISGPTDGDQRAPVAKIKTGVEKKKDDPKRGANDIPELTIMKLAAGEKIVIDGKGDDKAWGGAASTGPFVDVGTGRPNTSFPVKGSAKIAWDDDAIYFLIDVKDPDLVGYFTTKEEQPKDWTAGGQPMLWGKACAEIMLDPDGDGDNVNYYEIQINPQNKVFKSQFDTLQRPAGGPMGPFGHEEWDPKMKNAVGVHGTIDDKNDKDEGYTVEVAIPWPAFEKGAKNRPPKPGDQWRINMYAMKGNGGPSWSAILGQGNFHHAPRFGRITFATKEWLAAKNAADGGAPDGGAVDGGKDASSGADAATAATKPDGGAAAPTTSTTAAPPLRPTAMIRATAAPSGAPAPTPPP
jgi:hypothetical protein